MTANWMTVERCLVQVTGKRVASGQIIASDEWEYYEAHSAAITATEWTNHAGDWLEMVTIDAVPNEWFVKHLFTSASGPFYQADRDFYVLEFTAVGRNFGSYANPFEAEADNGVVADMLTDEFPEIFKILEERFADQRPPFGQPFVPETVVRELVVFNYYSGKDPHTDEWDAEIEYVGRAEIVVQSTPGPENKVSV